MPAGTQPEEGRNDHELHFTVDRFVARLAGAFPREVVEEIVAESRRRFTGARVTAFVPALVEHRAYEQLRELIAAQRTAG